MHGAGPQLAAVCASSLLSLAIHCCPWQHHAPDPQPCCRCWGRSRSLATTSSEPEECLLLPLHNNLATLATRQGAR